MPAIVVEGLTKAYEGKNAVADLSFSVEAGEVFGLLGPNGAGKTTTLRMLAGLLAPDAGRAEIAGARFAAPRGGGPDLRRRVGLLTEQPGFYDRLGARENLVFFARLYGVPARRARARADDLLERFDLGSAADRPFGALSRGMKQKLAVARSLLHAPRVVLLDEPTVGLDPGATREVRRIVEELAAEGVAVLLCTHQLAEVERLCGRAAFLAGRLVGIHDVAQATGVVRVRVELEGDSADWVAPAGALDGVRSVAAAPGALDLELISRSAVPELVAALAGAGARITAVHPAAHALEEAWLSLLARARAEGLVA